MKGPIKDTGDKVSLTRLRARTSRVSGIHEKKTNRCIVRIYANYSCFYSGLNRVLTNLLTKFLVLLHLDLSNVWNQFMLLGTLKFTDEW